MRFNILSKTAFAAVLGFGMVGGAQAALVFVSLPSTGNENDCSGMFGTAPNCNVLGPNDADGVNKFSPLIVKYDKNNDGTTKETTINPLFSSFTGSEITVTYNILGETGTGAWTYNQGASDPSIKYWTAKGGNSGFNLWWMVDDTELQAGGACVGDVYTDTCLAKALVQTSGSFKTPLMANGQYPGLSHIGFYDTAQPPDIVPLPAAAWLLLSGLGGLGLLGRRRKAA